MQHVHPNKAAIKKRDWCLGIAKRSIVRTTSCLSFAFWFDEIFFSSVWNFPLMPSIFLFSFLHCNSSKYSGRFIKLLILLHGVGKVMDRLFTPQHQLVLIALFSLVYLIASPMVFKDLPTPLLQALTLLVPPYFNSLSIHNSLPPPNS